MKRLSQLNSHRLFEPTVKKVFEYVLFLLIILVFINNQVALAQFDSALAEDLQAALDNSIQANNIIGASAAVIVPEQGTWLGTSGYSVPATSDTIRSDMLFGIASITKTYTTAMILKLADDGVLSLDDSLHRWIPSFQHVDSTITIRQLLQHTSGIYDYMEHPAFLNSLIADFTRFWSAEEILTTFLNPPYFSPGTSWKYSNANYIIAGMIIEAATGNNVSAELRNRFLDPQNLNNTFLELVDTQSVEIVHSWADLDFDGELDDLYPNTNLPAVNSMTWTAAAMIATAEDLARWAGLLYSGAFFSQAYMNEMLSFYPIPTPLITGYGLGAMRFEYRGRTFWGHNGSLPGINTIMLYSPEDGTSIVVLLNQRPGDGSSGYVFPVVTALVDAYLDHVPTGVADSDLLLPEDFVLHQNYPNPFNPATVIRYELAAASEVRLTIYNALGQKVRTLVSGRQSPGVKSVVWDGKNGLSQPVSSGIYFYTLKADERAQTKKMALMR